MRILDGAPVCCQHGIYSPFMIWGQLWASHLHLVFFAVSTLLEPAGSATLTIFAPRTLSAPRAVFDLFSFFFESNFFFLMDQSVKVKWVAWNCHTKKLHILWCQVDHIPLGVDSSASAFCQRILSLPRQTPRRFNSFLDCHQPYPYVSIISYKLLPILS